MTLASHTEPRLTAVPVPFDLVRGLRFLSAVFMVFLVKHISAQDVAHLVSVGLALLLCGHAGIDDNAWLIVDSETAETANVWRQVLEKDRDTRVGQVPSRPLVI